MLAILNAFKPRVSHWYNCDVTHRYIFVSFVNRVEQKYEQNNRKCQISNIYCAELPKYKRQMGVSQLHPTFRWMKFSTEITTVRSIEMSALKSYESWIFSIQFYLERERKNERESSSISMQRMDVFKNYCGRAEFFLSTTVLKLSNALKTFEFSTYKTILNWERRIEKLRVSERMSV